MKFAYLIEGNGLKIKNIKGIGNKIRFWLLKKSRNVRICRISDIYDERLVKIGELFGIFNADKIDEGTDLSDYFLQREIKHVCCGDMEIKKNNSSVKFYRGADYRFMKNTDNFLMHAKKTSEYLFVVSSRCLFDDIFRVAKGLRYINIFCDDRAFMHDVTAKLYDIEGIVAGQRDSLRDVLDNNYEILIFDESFLKEHDDIVNRILYVDFYAVTDDKCRVYSEVIGEFYLNDTYFEYKFCSENK